MDYKIHLAFGFHVNCYHSYRGDSNDNLGFGSDIRIIRQILHVLDDFNRRGVPVKATWDTENFFSLEKILPQYAPDIIAAMQRRVKENGDENIIMGYNNGALSAMTDEELTASIQLARTNEAGSGLADIFGKCEDIVRPQEVMFTPSQVHIYKKLGIKALCLYYSCVPFDAFRTIIPRLPDEAAFNPLKYTYQGESITIVPTYSNADICDAGCLRSWVKDLRRKQESGKIQRDLLLFINMDADAIFWETMHLPVVGSKIANTDGIHGLVKEVADLPYIVFDTVGGYLKNHGTIREIQFTQDTADGNFTGYASWAEKPYNRKIWTAIERSRAMGKVNAAKESDSPSFLDRVLLLSTTHFGLATPVLNIEREKKANALAQKIVAAEKDALPKADTLTIYNTSGSDLQCVQLKRNGYDGALSALKITGDGLSDYGLVTADESGDTVFALLRFKTIQPRYTVKITVDKAAQRAKASILKSKNLKAVFSEDGRLTHLEYKGKKLGGTGFSESYITYCGKKYPFSQGSVRTADLGGSVEGLLVEGAIHLPNEQVPGRYSFLYFTVASCDAVFVRTTVQYPYTPETTSISTENSALGRYSDMLWQEAVPFQLTPTLNGDIRVVKRNFANDVSAFRTASFRESDAMNTKLDSFNHQLSCCFVGLSDGNCGLLVANARQVLGSMAHCPMRLEQNGTVKMNPFGTYYGKQRHHFSRANGEILDAYTLIAVQGKSIAPAYNGVRETAVLGLFGFEGEMPSQKSLKEVTAFSDGAVATAPKDALLIPFYDDNVTFPKVRADHVEESKLKNPVMTGFSGNLFKYIRYGAKAIGHILKAQIQSK